MVGVALSGWLSGDALFVQPDSFKDVALDQAFCPLLPKPLGALIVVHGLTLRHYPHLNLGKVYLAKGERMRALDEFVKALEFQPEDPVVMGLIQKINYTVN